MNPGRSPPPETARRFGVWMTAGAWLAILAVASLVFGDWLAERENPNRRVATGVDGDGARVTVACADTLQRRAPFRTSPFQGQAHARYRSSIQP